MADQEAEATVATGIAADVVALLGLTTDEEAYLLAQPDVWDKLKTRLSERESLNDQLATAKAHGEAVSQNFGEFRGTSVQVNRCSSSRYTHSPHILLHIYT